MKSFELWILNFMKHTAYIALGSNLDNRADNIHRSLELISSNLHGTSILKLSRLYETSATGEKGQLGQPPFINAVAKIATEMPPRKLLSNLIEIEKTLGRPHPRPKGEARTIDLDILLYDDLSISLPDLTIPHPGISKRLFVLTPLCDIDPTVIHPTLGVTVLELKERLIHDAAFAAADCNIRFHKPLAEGCTPQTPYDKTR